MSAILCSRMFFTCLVALGCFTTASLQGQTASGTVDGTVTDSSGAGIPNAKILLTNLGTGIQRAATADGSGSFRMAGVPPGGYKLESQATGFKTGTVQFKLDVAGLQTLKLALEIGQITESVNVSAAVQQVNTEEGTISGVVQEAQVQNLPLNGRDVFTLEILQPGVTQAMTARIANFTATDSGINWAEAKYSFNAAGHPVTTNDYLLDGLSNNSPIYGGKPAATPAVDSVQEFRMQENNFQSEYGRNSGAVVNVLTKSGTNQFHGTAYWFLRNNALDSRTVFDPAHNAPLRQDQAGFTLGGPVTIPKVYSGKNRTFFFFGFEDYHQFKGSSQIGTFETPEFRALVHQMFPGSAQDQLLQKYPAPAIIPGTAKDVGSPSATYATPGPKDGIPDVGQASYVTSTLTTSKQYNIRADHRLSSNNSLFGRWTAGPAGTSPVDPRSSQLGLAETGFQGQGVLGDTHIVSSNMVNEFRYGYGRNRITDTIPALPGIPTVTISANIGGDAIGGFAATGVPSQNIGEEYSLSDIFSINHGHHAFKFGYEHHWNQDNGNRFTQTNGAVAYRGLMDFASNLADTSTVRVNPGQVGGVPVPVGTPRDYRQQDNGMFVHDNWKVTKRLSLNIGVRWDRFGPATERNGLVGQQIFGSGGDAFERTMNATVGRVPYVYKPGNQWAPRFGFAWDVTGDGKTSVRGGYGIAYDRLQFLAFRGGVRFNPPDSATMALAVRTLATPLGISQTQLSQLLGTTLSFPYHLPAGTTSKGFNAGGGAVIGLNVNGVSTTINPSVSVTGQESSIKTPYSQNYFLAVQRELASKLVLEVTFIGNVGRHEPNQGFNYNRYPGDVFGAPNPYNGANAGDTGTNLLNPYLGSVTVTGYNLTSSYNGGYVSLKKRFSGGLSFESAYTYGHSIDYTPIGRNDPGTPDPRILALQKGTSAFDVTHRFTNNFVWEIPYRRSQQGFMGKVFGGWQMQGILSAQSGTPFTVSSSSANWDFNGDGTSSDRPDAPTGNFGSMSRQRFLNGMFGSNTPIGANSLNLPTTVTQAQAIFFPSGMQPVNACYAAGKTGPVRQLAGRPCFAEGNLGRNTFRGPGYADIDGSLFKNFRLPVGENTRLQFRAEFFNLANRVNLQQVDPGFDSATFGKATSAFDAREIQFALKLMF